MDASQTAHSAISRFIYILLLSVIPLLSGCVTIRQHQISPSGDGMKPKVAVLTSVPEAIHFEYIGHTIFDNGRSDHALDANIAALIDREAKRLITQSELVDLHDTGDADKNPILNYLPRPIDSYWHSPIPDAELRVLSEWGRENDVDYLAVIFPNKATDPIFENHEDFPGRGVLVTHDLTYLYSAYQVQLVDLSSGYIDYTSNIATFKQVPIYRHKLTNSDKQRILREWGEEKRRTYKPGHDYETPEMVISRASIYKVGDFENISDVMLHEIDQQLKPVVKAGIRQNLIDAGLVSGPNTSLSNILAPDERVKRPIR